MMMSDANQRVVVKELASSSSTVLRFCAWVSLILTAKGNLIISEELVPRLWGVILPWTGDATLNRKPMRLERNGVHIGAVPGVCLRDCLSPVSGMKK